MLSSFRVLTFLMLFAALVSCKARRTGSGLETVGGTKAEVGKVPEFVLKHSVGIRNSLRSCSGVLVAPRAVLTADHCVGSSMVAWFSLKLGEGASIKITGTPVRRAAKDIAVVYLEERAPEGYVPTKIAQEAFIMKDDALATLTGYGVWFETGNGRTRPQQSKEQGILQFVDLPADTTDADVEAVDIAAKATKLNIKADRCKKDGGYHCFFATEAGSFHGDSGGPIFNRETEELIGILIEGITRVFYERDITLHRRNMPKGKYIGISVATDLYPEMKWLNDAIKGAPAE